MKHWAVCLTGWLNVVPSEGWPVYFPFFRSLYAAIACWLATVGKWKSWALLTEVSLWETVFVSGTLVLTHVSSIGSTLDSTSWPGQERGAPSAIFSERATQTFGACLESKVLFRLWTSKLKSWLCFDMFPGVCLALPQKGLVCVYFPISSIVCFVTRVRDVFSYCINFCLVCILRTISHVWPTVMLMVIHILDWLRIQVFVL